MDKTGTLTEGKPRFDRVVGSSEYSEDEVLRLAASLDQGSEHPLADANVRAARERKLDLDKVEGFESGTGIGVRGTLGGRQLVLGNNPAAEALATLKASGIRVIMATGDGISNALRLRRSVR